MAMVKELERTQYVEALPARGRPDPDPRKAPHHRQEGCQDKVCRVYEEHGTLARLRLSQARFEVFF